MATAEQVKALLKSYSEGESEHFVSIALQIAAGAARGGKRKLAQELRELVDQIKQRQESGKISGSVQLARPTGELAGLLSAAYPKTRISDMVLNNSTLEPLSRLVREYSQQDKLRSHGYSARRKLLLVGPPGCGKTMTASALAGEFRLPLFTVQLHGLITKFMGETAGKLHAIFNAMTETRGVYLFDEFDAIGADRSTRNDVGEIRRVLNSFLQFLELDDSDSVIIAATNFVGMLDDALFRRFDDVVHYLKPNADQTQLLVKNRLRSFLPARPTWKKVCHAAIGLSHAEVSRACDDAAKDCILSGQDRLLSSDLITTLANRHRMEQWEEGSLRKE